MYEVSKNKAEVLTPIDLGRRCELCFRFRNYWGFWGVILTGLFFFGGVDQVGDHVSSCTAPPNKR